LAPPFEEEDRSRNQSRRQSSGSREQEAVYEQEYEHLQGHSDPRCVNWAAERVLF